jgi:hypothetical protein
MGLNDQDIVALELPLLPSVPLPAFLGFQSRMLRFQECFNISGAHTLGRVRPERSGFGLCNFLLWAPCNLKFLWFLLSESHLDLPAAFGFCWTSCLPFNSVQVMGSMSKTDVMLSTMLRLPNLSDLKPLSWELNLYYLLVAVYLCVFEARLAVHHNKAS